ncbi:unnamed protein product [Bemisia tabaci]|uniref:BolA-like protein n=1 Tax=Bemisia tabaci TaxID=7038 RepID=A0A9N9ZZ99_BEMTA|nr:unnamed protein product [Bemisia tabaci]
MNSLLRSLTINTCGNFHTLLSRSLSRTAPNMIQSSETSLPFDYDGAPIESSIRKKLTESLSPMHLEIVNESYMHNTPDSETHFKLLIISTAFLNKSPIQRHRMVYELLDEELKKGVHALSIVAKTPDQWHEGKRDISPSPKCRGGFGK